MKDIEMMIGDSAKAPVLICKQCQCKFLLIVVWPTKEDYGEEGLRWANQTGCTFCPYCGEKWVKEATHD